MNIRIRPVSCSAELETLLSRAGLPVSDLGKGLPLHLFGARVNGMLIGVVGVEVYKTVGLLRSLAVEAAFRQGGVGRALVAHAETWAVQCQVNELYLLTTTAAGFFAHLGYEVVSRSEAPKAIARTTQFEGLCPSSSTFMRKKLASFP